MCVWSGRWLVCGYIITTVCVITLHINTYSDRLLPLPRQFLHIPHRIHKFMDLRVNCSTPCFYLFCWNLISTWRFVSFYLLNCYLHSASQAPNTIGSTECISVCLTSLTSFTFNSWEKWFLHLADILWQSATKSPFLSFLLFVPGVSTIFTSSIV